MCSGGIERDQLHGMGNEKFYETYDLKTHGSPF